VTNPYDLIPYDVGPQNPVYRPTPLRNVFPRTTGWRYLDWEVSADGYRLVIEHGVIIGLAYDEWPWPWGDPRYDAYECIWDARLEWRLGSRP
jgi:hypothetical protein